MSKISDKSVNVICTDLPYGITACTWDSVIPLDKLWEQYKRVIADNGIIILFGQEPFSSHCRAKDKGDCEGVTRLREQRVFRFLLFLLNPL